MHNASNIYIWHCIDKIKTGVEFDFCTCLTRYNRDISGHLEEFFSEYSNFSLFLYMLAHE